jgi:hypothetical protein
MPWMPVSTRRRKNRVQIPLQIHRPDPEERKAIRREAGQGKQRGKIPLKV